MSQQEASAKAILFALLANFGIAIAKTWGAWFTGSGSMFAEAIHSYADTGNQVLLFVGLSQSKRPADDRHPLGYGKLSYFWAFVVAIMLFSLGGIFSIYEGFHKLQHPEPLRQIWVGLLILGVAIVLEVLSLIGALSQIRRVRAAKSFRHWLRTTRNAELVVVFGEDVAAVAGLIIAFAFLGMSGITGDPFYDGLGSICIGVVLIIVSIFVAIRIKSLLVGRSAEPDLKALIESIISADPDIDGLLNTITLQLGPKFMLAAKIKMRPDLSIEEAVDRINALEAKLKDQVPEIGWCFMEPDCKD